MKICIDPGHGGHDSGAAGPSGIMEKTIVLRVAKELGAILKRERHEVYFTRRTDIFVPLRGRATFSNEIGVDLFLSLHCNAGGGEGFEAFTTRGRTRADKWATKLLNYFQAWFPSRKIRTDPQDGDPDKEASFTVLTNTSAPAVLFELGFIDHEGEELWLDKHAMEIAKCLAWCIMDKPIELGEAYISSSPTPITGLDVSDPWQAIDEALMKLQWALKQIRTPKQG